MTKKHLGSSVDAFLKVEGTFEDAQAQAAKEVVAWQLAAVNGGGTGDRMTKPPNLVAFHTGLMASDYHRFPDPPYKANSWHLELVEPSSEFPIGSEMVGDKIYPAKEVIIWARNDATAQRAADLVHAARLAVEGSNLLSHIYPGEHAPLRAASGANVPEEDEGDPELSFATSAIMTPLIPLACLVAARASWRLQYVYALAKLRQSFEMCSLPSVELDPHHSANVPKSPLPEDHVRFAFAIVAAYSCIEELGLEVRASSQKPSKLSDGSWNPPVRADLEERLAQGHINLKESCLWNLRGSRTRLEKKRPPSIIQKAKWASHRVRDGEMAVIDALNYVSFLRSQVAAHKTSKSLLRALSVYDVANTQFLARRLLLERMGFWRYWRERRRQTRDPT